MPVNLDAPLSWTTADGDDAVMLDQLQPNILKGHVREHLVLLFLHFADQAAAKTFLRALVPLMKSAKVHLEEVQAFKAPRPPDIPPPVGTPYVGVGLTRTGYNALGTAAIPADKSFRRGMKDPASRNELTDPPLSLWEAPYRNDIHAVVLIGDTTDAAVSTRREEVLALLTDTVTVIVEETGLSQRNAHGEGIEHFGYIDGRSQPLFLTEDLDEERDSEDGSDVWDPCAPLGRVLVADPAATSEPSVHFGSYFIFRKLEQNVRRFKQAEEDLADTLKLKDADRDRAGAMIVGRFEDGTPLTLQSADGAHHPVMNNFTYGSDADGGKCPLHAHIRKTNPRGSGGVESPDKERLHLMARRGQTYGERADVPFDDAVPLAARPTGGVGLLFMAFNANVHIDFSADDEPSQFDFTQSIWANNPDFPDVPDDAPAPGLDPVIGQGPRPKQTYPTEWGEAATQEVDAIPQAVRMKGGEYFFMPSLPFLRGL